MKIVYVTYKQDGLLKKATINEDRYKALLEDPTVTGVIIYSSQLLMENNFNAQCSRDGSCGSRRIILG